MAWYLDSVGSHADALIASEEVLRLRPDDPEAWFHKGVAFAKFGRHAEAEMAFDTVLRLRPSDRQAYMKRRWPFEIKIDLSRN